MKKLEIKKTKPTIIISVLNVEYTLLGSESEWQKTRLLPIKYELKLPSEAMPHAWSFAIQIYIQAV